MRLGLGISIPGTSGLVQAAFSPLDLSPVLWLDASDTSTITEVGGAVSQWDDLSGNGNDVVQATAALQPTTGTRTLNSLNVIDFQDDGMNVTFSSSISQPNTIIIVLEQDLTQSASFFDGSTAAARNLGGTLTTTYRMLSDTTITGGTTDTDPHILRFLFNGASSTLHVDGVGVISGNSGAEGIAGFTVGNNYPFTGNFTGAIAEVIVVDGTLTAGQISDTESYLANKWGITI